MRFSFAALAIAVSAVQQVLAHGYVPQVKIGNQYLPGWDVTKDGYTTPRPVRIVRATKADSGFISDPSSTDITCSIGNNPLPSVRLREGFIKSVPTLSLYIGTYHCEHRGWRHNSAALEHLAPWSLWP
jgi:hypothetical protein